MVGQTAMTKKYDIPGFVQINDTLYISKYEVSIRDYAKFLLYLYQKTKDTVKLNKCLPNPNFTDWTMWSSFSNKLIKYDDYLLSTIDTSITFTSWLGNFPVVNVDKSQANDFCKFKGFDYNVFYQNLKPKKKKSYPENIVFRLPTSKEWKKIANTLLEDQTVISKEFFYKDTTGQSMPLQVFQGCLNSLEIYNMTGNVAELVSDNDNVYGGSFKETIENCNSTSSRKFILGDNATGFRVVAIIK